MLNNPLLTESIGVYFLNIWSTAVKVIQMKTEV